ncbi:hypothetical protein [Sphingopyxis sp. GW247-27LB]|uniref:hypothetical protein n=1 Tax=Sphingopyxis sp. GW247-27LB TaxID=2012632 RepID=UPI000BA73D87|nr:hypothetical protein [Sphingopyxis sp. GW247-27LB]PAL23544.1 hypothetical protein CD928_05610 [Sphingopyxis sp. GW247-27LB]
MIAGWIIAIVISVALQAVSMLLRPKAKSARDASVKELEAPTADRAKPVGVVFGRVIVKDPNVLWFGDKSSRTYQVKA